MQGQSAESRVAQALGQEESKEPMQQSFYRKEGLDYLYFQRPGTAYGKDAFAAMGTATRSGFASEGKCVKPLELITSKNTSLVQQLWFARAQKIIDQITHLQTLVEFFDFCFVLSLRFSEYLTQPTGNKYEVRSFLELYQTWTPDYDLYLHKHGK